ncbi:MAG: hypothetical protein A2V66_14360 [Ignavibacteria bacterium RBG_13_36_8]|nr:MAG: hypothetical protein A2V66_14360 [Ignavibacteria bacterium RBG_13_36_8]
MALNVSTLVLAKSGPVDFAQPDSVDLMREFSLFYEAHKNKQFEQWTLDRGFAVINNNPTTFIKYNPFIKMEEIIFYLHDSVSTTTDQEKEALADTLVYLYDVATKYDSKKAGYYLARKAYVLEMWENTDPNLVIPAYEKALDMDWNIQNDYKDRLGILYSQNASDSNDYKLKALDLYSRLSEEEPDNPRWLQRIEQLAENVDELVEITGKAWYLNKDNLEKAWKYASTGIRAQSWEKAQEPLEFLIQKAPDVINYWKQLASVYDKLNKNDSAINAYKKLIELQPDSRDNFINIALVYKKIDQLSVARTYLRRSSALSPEWDYPYYIEGSLYEQAVRNCMGAKFEFMDKCVFQLAVETYQRARSMGGQFTSTAAERISALSNSIPQKEDYFFRKMQSGETIKIDTGCYGWIGKTITVP